jgi:hypothetical protein
MTTKRSAVTDTLSAMAANYDALATEQDDDKRQLIRALLVQLIGEYARMGRVLAEAQRHLPGDRFAQFLTDHAIDFVLAVHAIQLAEGQFGTQ